MAEKSRFSALKPMLNDVNKRIAELDEEITEIQTLRDERKELKKQRTAMETLLGLPVTSVAQLEGKRGRKKKKAAIESRGDAMANEDLDEDELASPTPA